MMPINQPSNKKEDDWGLVTVKEWKLSFCLVPRTCFLTGAKLWLTWAYKGVRVFPGNGEPIVEYYYLDQTAYARWSLKRKRYEKSN